MRTFNEKIPGSGLLGIFIDHGGVGLGDVVSLAGTLSSTSSDTGEGSAEVWKVWFRLVLAPMNTGGVWMGVIIDLNTEGGGGGTMVLEVVDFDFGRRDLSPKNGCSDLSDSESTDLMVLAALE